MWAVRGALGLAATGLLLAVMPRCAPEELVYQPSVPVDGSAGTGGAGGAGGTGVGGTSGWPEVCGNGLDDDLNGKTDCEDPTCETFACVDLPPTGWTGPAALFQGPPGGVADCPEGLTAVYEGQAGVVFEPATCTCSCGTPESTTCSGTATYYGDASCATAVTSAAVDPGAGCSAAYTGAVVSVQISYSPSGTCGAGTADPPVTQPPSWKLAARACVLESGSALTAGCAAGKVCAPLSGESLACVFRQGDVDCPAGYGTRRVYYQGTDDQRDCGGCSCGFAADSCSADITGFLATDCTSQVFGASSAGCYGADVHSLSATNPVMNNARCDPLGSTATGCVVPSEPTTICCVGGTGSGCPSGKGPSMVEVLAEGGSVYCIDSTEVTKGQYADFLATAPAVAGQPAECSWNTDFQPPSDWPPGLGEEDEPVAFVDWCDAAAFCAWAGKRLCGKIGGGTLPIQSGDDASQSQWFNACSAGGTQSQPYGDQTIPGACPYGTLSPVKSHPCCQGGTPGLYDLVGNATEWEDSCEGASPNPSNDNCAVRGDNSCAASDTQDRSDHMSRLGFRCCS